jgi:RNA polymerase sigma-70 factor (ECF subfamily)
VDETALCKRFAGRIRAYGLRHLRNEQAARDLVQHVLLAVIEASRAGRIEDPERIDAYVLGTCRNASRDMRRGALRQDRVADAMAAVVPSGWEPDWSGPDRLRLQGCLQKLEPRDRAVVIMTFMEEQTAEAIAAALAVSPGNVRVIRHRTLARLLSCLEGP